MGMRELWAVVAAACFSLGAANAAPPPVAAFSTPAAIRLIQISPDGEHLAIVSRNGDQALIKFVTVDQDKVVVAKLGDVAITRVRWLGNDQVMVDAEFPTKIYNNYRTIARVVVVTAQDGRAVTMLADNKPSNNRLRHWVSGVSPDNHLFMFGFPATAVATQKISPVLLRVDPADGKGEPIEEGKSDTTDWLIDKDGAVWGSLVSLKEGNFAIEALPVAGAAPKELWRSATLEDRRGYHGYSAPENAILITAHGPEGDQLTLKHLADGSTTLLGRPHKTDPMTYVWDTKARTLAGRGFGVERPEMEWLQPDLVAVQASLQKSFKTEEVYLADWSTDRSRFVVWVASPDMPTAWYLFDKTHHELSPLGETHPDLKGVQLGATHWMTYKARDGLELGAYVTLPPAVASAGGRLPLVVVPHDELRSRDTFGFDFLAQLLATRGYAVLRPQYRGSSGFGEAFEKAGDWEWGGKIETDLLDGVAALATQGIVDPKRVCIIGEDFAGYLALTAAALHPKDYACAVSISGASDLTGLRAGWGGSPFAAMRLVLEKTDFRDPKYAAMSPRVHAANVEAPILLMWKDEDAIMPPEQSKAMAQALDAAHKSVETLVLTNIDHSARTGTGAMQMFEALDAFLGKNLPVHQP
jgi:dipeptidyl aminopeptidase/acylaminoacyl peptidase